LLPQAKNFFSGAFPPDIKIAFLRVLRVFVVKSFKAVLNHEDTKKDAVN